MPKRTRPDLAPPQVVNGARYTLLLHGSGYKPRLALSTYSHDFGPVHVWRSGVEPAVAVVRARNEDAQPVSFEVLWGDHEHLTVSAPVVWPSCRWQAGKRISHGKAASRRAFAVDWAPGRTGNSGLGA